MYSRSYYGSDSEIKIPENYDGTAFSEKEEYEEIKAPRIESTKNEPKFSPSESIPETEEVFVKNESPEKRKLFGIDFGGIFDKFIPKGLFEKSFLPEKFGTEELLIIGIALFLLFSKNGDKECAFLLLALIFIN